MGTSEVPKNSLTLLEILGIGRAGDPFGDHEGKRIFIEGAPKNIKWVVVEVDSIKERFGSAKFIEAFKSLEEAKSRLEELRRAKRAKPEMLIKRPVERRMENVVFVGRKPAMSYVLAVITSFARSNAEEVTLKARGQAIPTAVDVAELARRRFMKELEIGKISIGTEEMPSREGEGKARMVSTIEITLTTEAKPKEEAKATQKAKAPATEVAK